MVIFSVEERGRPRNVAGWEIHFSGYRMILEGFLEEAEKELWLMS